MIDHNTYESATDIRSTTVRPGVTRDPVALTETLDRRSRLANSKTVLVANPFAPLLPHVVILWTLGALCVTAAFQSEDDAVRYAKSEASSRTYLPGTCFVVPGVGHAGVNCLDSIATSVWVPA